jgi:hypothetical protein
MGIGIYLVFKDMVNKFKNLRIFITILFIVVLASIIIGCTATQKSNRELADYILTCNCAFPSSEKDSALLSSYFKSGYSALKYHNLIFKESKFDYIGDTIFKKFDEIIRDTIRIQRFLFYNHSEQYMIKAIQSYGWTIGRRSLMNNNRINLLVFDFLDTDKGWLLHNYYYINSKDNIE